MIKNKKIDDIQTCVLKFNSSSISRAVTPQSHLYDWHCSLYWTYITGRQLGAGLYFLGISLSIPNPLTATALLFLLYYAVGETRLTCRTANIKLTARWTYAATTYKPTLLDGAIYWNRVANF